MLSARSEPVANSRRGRLRTCVGCRREAAPDDLVRVVLGADGAVVPDLAGGSLGRGAWLHPEPRCLAQAAPAGLSASFRARVLTSPDELWALLRAAADRRVAALLGAARRAGKLEVGATAVDQALLDGRAELVMLAVDARAAASGAACGRAIAEGRGLAWGSKETLGRALGRSEVAAAAVVDRGLSQALKRAVAMAHMPAPSNTSDGRGAPASSRADGPTEDR
jgi:uncharacterized protein